MRDYWILKNNSRPHSEMRTTKSKCKYDINSSCFPDSTHSCTYLKEVKDLG